MSLTITEIYSSIQGEANFAGWPCTFIRAAGCPLRCRWCDTAYSFKGGDKLEISEIVGKVQNLGNKFVELTGGEPLAQPDMLQLAEELTKLGFRVMIETGGSLPIKGLNPAVHIIMDLKCPGSGMDGHNLWENIQFLKSSDEVKFVIASQDDFDWALNVCLKENLFDKCQILMSPAFGLVAPDKLAEWILSSKRFIRLNLQQHKYIWHPRARGV